MVTPDDCPPSLQGLKAFLELRIAALERLTDERFSSADRALSLQSAELARRLDSLNGEADRLRQMQASYLPREVAEAALGDQARQLTHLRETRAYALGYQTAIGAAVAAVVSLLVAVAHVYVIRGAP